MRLWEAPRGIEDDAPGGEIAGRVQEQWPRNRWRVVALCILGKDGEIVKGAPGSPVERGSDVSGPRRARTLARGELGPEEAAEKKKVRPRVSALLACSWFKSPEGDRPVQLRPAGIGPSTERRVLPRIQGLVLTEGQRERARSMLARAAGCRTRFAGFRKCVPSGVGAVESRLIVALPCGTRMCEECDQQRRNKEAARVEGHWRLFWTLGLPQHPAGVRFAWGMMGVWTRRLFRELRREYAKGASEKVKIDEGELQRIEIANEERKGKKRPLAELQYAWCLEPHASGFPHLHFVLNAWFVDFGFMKELWSRIVGLEVRWARYEKVTDRDGMCRYLSKYISKTSFPPDLVAIMYRRRQWASTVPPREEAPGEWVQEKKEDAADPGWVVENQRAYERVSCWDRVMGKEGKYALYTRLLKEEDYKKWQALASSKEGFAALELLPAEDWQASGETPFSIKRGAKLEILSRREELSELTYRHRGASKKLTGFSFTGAG